MSKRLQHPAGPANMKANYLKAVLGTDGQPALKLHKGFTGFKGWSYHPTRGFKKVSGFNATQFKSISAVPIQSAIDVTTTKSIDEELAELLSGSVQQ
jgi:hypothetical protein